MKDISLPAFLGQLDSAIKGVAPGTVALAFDADGTLWSGDAGEDFLFALLERKLVLGEALEALTREAEKYGVACQGLSPTEIARALFDAYVAGRYPEDSICRVTAWSCVGYTEESVRRLAHGILVDAKLPTRILPETQEIVRFAASRGMPVYIVSASPEHVVRAGVSLCGFSCERVLAVEPEYVLGRMLPRTHEPIPYGAGKRKVLERELESRGASLLAAFGDNVFDIPMLAHATYGVAVRPKKRLLDALSPAEEESFWHLLPAPPDPD